MASGTFRAAIAAGLALALLVLASPARAAVAPFCDDRGASALAAPPVRQAADTVIRRAPVTPCDEGQPLAGASLSRVPRTLVRALVPSEPALEVAPLRLVLPERGVMSAARPAAAPLAEGVGSRIERPPRA